MKRSIRFKIISVLTFLIVLTIFLTWLINRSFLSDYYRHNKIKTLADVYQKVVEIYNESEEEMFLSEEEVLEVERLSSYNNVNIYVIMSWAGRWIYHYPEPTNIGNREKFQIEYLVRDYLNVFDYYDIPESYSRPNSEKTLIKETAEYMICNLYDLQLDSSYMDLVGGLEDNKIIFIRSNYESVQESVQLANQFLAYIGLIVLLIGIVSMLIISRKFTRPILELADIAKRMSDLDFEVHYEIQSKDEISELGNSINILSDRLKETISELKRANNELLTDIQRKTQIDEMRKEFLSNVSHELKTPISLIQGYAEGLMENINEDAQSRNYYCEVIIDEADRMNKLVKGLLSLNELESGNNQVSFQRFNLTELIQSVLDSSEILFRQKEVTVKFDGNTPIFVWADEFLVEQVVSNYVRNALNHVNGLKIIEIKMIRYGDVIRTAVFNTGDNIPEEELDKIWIKFYKVDKARTRSYGGSGIGLSIVKAIMNSHNRECGVVNHSSGVEFWFELDTGVE